MATEAYNIRPNTNQSLIMSIQDLKDAYLFGVDMTDDNGNPFPDIIFERSILSAQKWMESEIPGLLLCCKEIEEVRDYYINDYIAYSFMKLNWFPVIEMSEFSVQFPLSTNALKFDPAWYRVDSPSAHARLVPTQGTFSSIVLSQGGSFLPLFYSGLDNVPAIWKIKYKAGFRKGEIDQNILDIIGMKASMGPLNIAGDLIAGAGIATKSIGLDGLSQSISTTASATNSGYGARILQYNKEISDRMKSIKSLYAGIQMTVA